MATLTAPGATPYYEVTGSGPVLLMIPGGGTDSAIFGGVVARLAADYTVVAFDPRGNSRSTYDGTPEDGPEPGAADALAVLDAVAGNEPAYVFGSSNGAVTGLELITQHPDRPARRALRRRPCRVRDRAGTVRHPAGQGPR